jgi:hypothetical protein
LTDGVPKIDEAERRRKRSRTKALLRIPEYLFSRK